MRELSHTFCIHSHHIGSANITLQPFPQPVSESGGTIEVCVEISGLTTGGLGCDLEVDMNVDGGVAGTYTSVLELCQVCM